MTVHPHRRTLAAVASGALLTGLLAGLVSPTSAAPGSPVHLPAHHVVVRVHRLHGPDIVYRPRNVHVPRTFFGIHDASGKSYGRIPFGSIRLWDAGVTWQDIETSPGVYDWSRLDSMVELAQAHHVAVTLVLGMTPSFYASSPSLPPIDLTAFTNYVTAVMQRYRWFNGSRGISSYQVWNEGNVSDFWTGTPQQLAQMTAIVHTVRNQVDPKATVVAPSFAVRMGYQRRWMTLFQRQIVDDRPVWADYDVNALSLYPKATYDLRTGGPEDAMRLLGKARADLAKAGVPARKKLWATEVNYGVEGAGTAKGAATRIPQARQVANVLRTYLLAAANGLSRVYWYRYDWGPVAPGGGTLANTILSDPHDYARVRAAGLALRTAEQWLRGELVGTHGHQPCARSKDGTYACTLHDRGVTRTIYWNPRRQVQVHVPNGARRQVSSGKAGGRPTYRLVRPRHRSRTVQVGYQPVMVRTS